MRKLTKFRHIFNVDEEDDFYDFIDDLSDKIDDLIDEIDDLNDAYEESVDEINNYVSCSAPKIFSRSKKKEKPKERCVIKKILNIFYNDKTKKHIKQMQHNVL